MPQVTEKVRTVTVPSDYDLDSAETFEQCVKAAVAQKPGTLRLDCRSLERIVSSHITLLWSAQVLCCRSGVALKLADCPDSLVRILKALDLTDAFAFEDGSSQERQFVTLDRVEVSTPHSYCATPFATTTSIDEAVEQFVTFLDHLQIGRDSILELRTVFYEVATNVRNHSGLTPDDSFRVDVTADSHGVTMTFTDSGRPFDSAAPPGPLDAMSASRRGKKRGFGLPIIHRLADSIVYRRTGQSQNALTVMKKWR